MTKTSTSQSHSPYKIKSGLTHAWHATKNSWRGIVFAVREEDAFRQELIVTAVGVPLALLLPFGAVERLMLIGSLVLILIVELLNSSIEAVIDRISFEHHDLSKRAKDYGSAAVTLSLLICAAVWITLTYRLFAG
jgi:diacylglycerol kinase (ATP)